MKHRFSSLIIILSFLASSQILIAQNDTISGDEPILSTLPLIDTGEPITHDSLDLTNSEEFPRIKKIYEDLVAARGDFRYPVPKFRYRDVDSYVASIDYTDNTITLEKKAYEVCAAMGDTTIRDAAVAFLLGHELTHFYEKHAWRRGFAQSNADIQIGQRLQEIQDGVAYETEADYLGGFLAYSAGYGAFDKGGEIIDSLYSRYDLGDTLKNYPTRQNRVILSKRSYKKLKKFVQVFEMSNYNLAVGQYESAQLLYEYILRYYQSRELYNNLGMVKVLDVMQGMNDKKLKYKYPTEIDLSISGDRGGTGIPAEDSISLLQAVRHFNAATNLDPTYAPAYLNKSICYSIIGELAKARFYLEHETIPIAQANIEEFKKTLEDAKILDAILLHKENETENKDKALAILRSISKDTTDVAGLNIKCINNDPLPDSDDSFKNWLGQDNIGSTNIEKFLAEPQIGNFLIQLNDTITFFQIKPDRSSKISFIQKEKNAGDETHYYGFQVTADNYTGKTKTNISIGDSREKVLSIHETPKNIVGSVRGELIIYPSVIFVIKDGKVTKWVTYGFDFK